MKKIFKALSLCGFLISVVACGDDVEQSTSLSYVENVTVYENLGTCDSRTGGRVVFVEDLSKAFICTGISWTEILLGDSSFVAGEDGKDGVDGAPGKDGDDGADGAPGKDGVDGEDGKSCVVESLPEELGYKVLCDGDSVGVLLNGKDGADGAPGKDGEDGVDGAPGKDGVDGEDGKSCVVESLPEELGYKVLCDGDSVGVLLNGKDGADGAPGKDDDDGNGCSLKNQADGSVILTCDGVEVSLRYCGEVMYNATTHFCFAESIYEKCNGEAYDVATETCKNGWITSEITDSRDSKVYNTIKIENKIWMTENLNYAQLGSCYNRASSCDDYGRLYAFYEAVKACPSGFHLPDTSEWNQLYNFVYNDQKLMSNQVGKHLKAATAWKSGNGLDTYGFAALPGGLRGIDNSYSLQGSAGYYWTSVDYRVDGMNRAYSRRFTTGDALIEDYSYAATAFDAIFVSLSVRCVKDVTF